MKCKTNLKQEVKLLKESDFGETGMLNEKAKFGAEAKIKIKWKQRT